MSVRKVEGGETERGEGKRGLFLALRAEEF